MSLTSGSMELQPCSCLVVIFKYLVSIYCIQDNILIFYDKEGAETQKKMKQTLRFMTSKNLHRRYSIYMK